MSNFNCMQFIVLNGFNGDNDERYIVEDLLVLWKVVYDCEMVLELCHDIAKPYIKDGKLESDTKRPEKLFTYSKSRSRDIVNLIQRGSQTQLLHEQVVHEGCQQAVNNVDYKHTGNCRIYDGLMLMLQVNLKV
ncbi:hypothetical protein B0H14DRAFT_2570080 [Mycena olivaceomarginata]|nr:hypothetical protein B0H14DRAFT_2570080 [Mycena olivaceomarginata]